MIFPFSKSQNLPFFVSVSFFFFFFSDHFAVVGGVGEIFGEGGERESDNLLFFFFLIIIYLFLLLSFFFFFFSGRYKDNIRRRDSLAKQIGVEEDAVKEEVVDQFTPTFNATNVTNMVTMRTIVTRYNCGRGAFCKRFSSQ